SAYTSPLSYTTLFRSSVRWTAACRARWKTSSSSLRAAGRKPGPGAVKSTAGRKCRRRSDAHLTAVQHLRHVAKIRDQRTHGRLRSEEHTSELQSRENL